MTDGSGQLLSQVAHNPDSGVTTQTDYGNPTDPNVQTVTTFDTLGNPTGTSTVTAAIDNTVGSLTYGQIIPNTYNIVNEDGTGTITATGQRTVNPDDGSYTDSLLSSATAQNPNGTLSVTQTSADGIPQPVNSQLALADLGTAVNETGDAITIIQAIQAGQVTLPAVASGLSLANTIVQGGATSDLGYAASGLGVLGDLVGFETALKQGNTLGVVSSAAYAVDGAASIYAESLGYTADATLSAVQVAAEDGFIDSVGEDTALSGASDVIGDIADVSPFLSIAQALENGNYVGAIAEGIGFAVAGPLGEAIGSIVGAVFGDLFSSPPPPWGDASVQWDAASGTIKISDTGGQGGDATAYNALASAMSGLTGIVAQYNSLGQPGLQLGLIPERMGALSFSGNQFHVTTVDPVTGQELNPGLYFNTSGSATGTYQGNASYFQTLGAYYTTNALALQAIAPEWEVQTAEMQAANNLSNAGLTETERAANLGHLAAPLPTGATTETWNPIALNFGGGLATTALAGSNVQFNVDGTDNLDANLTGVTDPHYLHQTAWLNNTDGFLVLDENMNGAIDNGQDMFSDSQVAGSYRGVASLATYDANGNGVINGSDPVFAQLGVWIDANGDGVMQSGEYHSLASLGVTSLNYALGTYTTANGNVHQMGTLNLQADTLGASYTAEPNGIQLATTNGQTTLDVTRLNNLNTLQANEVGFTTNEDVPAVIAVRGNGSTVQGLLDTDSVSNAPNAGRRGTGVQNAQDGTVSFDANAGTVTFTPTTGFAGTAGFDYTVDAGAYGQATAHVQVTVAQVDHPPVITGDALQQIPIYGYQVSIVANPDTGDTTTVTTLYQPGTGYANPNGTGPYSYRSAPVAYQTNPDAGTLSVTDQDYPVSDLTWSVVTQGNHGGIATVDGNGNWTYTGGQAIGGNDAFVVQVTDPQGGSARYTVAAALPPAPTGTGGGSDGGDDDSDADADGGDGGGDGGGDPLVLDLNKTGFHFTSVNDSNVFFRSASDGLRHQTAWFGGGNGVLAFDKYGDGIVHDSSQIDFQGDLPGALNSLQGLGAFDSNHDGVINSQDAMWSKLGVWVDTNQDGISESGEFQSLSSLGITSIDLSSTNEFSVSNGVVIDTVATFTYADGTTGQMADVTLPISSNVLVTNPDGTTSVAQRATTSTSTPMVYGDGNNLILGDVGDNNIQAGNGNNVIETGADNDIILAGNGSNTISSGDGEDVVVVGNGNNTVFFGAGHKTVVTGAGNNMIVGGSGNDVIMAGQGNNTIYAGTGNSVISAQDGDNTLVGGVGYNELIAGDGNNFFTDGGGRADMTAGTGSNTFTVNDTLDTITVAAPVAGTTAGVNTVRAGVNWTLGANQQILWGTGNAALTLAGNDEGDQIIGNGAADTLAGGAGNDTLADSGGAATLIGGLGDDTYIVSNAATVVIEAANAGTDTVKTSVSYTLPGNVENLIGTGHAALTLTGGSQDGATLMANDADDTLVVGSGVATLVGGSGNDTFVVNNAADVVQAQAAGNTNTILTSVSYAAPANVQYLTGTGSGDITLTGNGIGVQIQANSGDDTLIAGSGDNTLIGETGNDSFQLFNAADTVQLGSGQSTVAGGDGDIKLAGNANGAASIALGDGNSRIDLSANGNGNSVVLGNGSNIVLAGDGSNTVRLGSGQDHVALGNGDNEVTAADAAGVADTIGVGSGANTIIVGQGDDDITAGNGANTVGGGNGNDTVELGASSNSVALGAGSNNVTAADIAGAVDTIQLGDGDNHVGMGQGNDQIGAGNGANAITTGNGNSQIQVGNGQNTITVGDGNNTLTNGTGTNALHVGIGNDTIVNNGGNDTLYFASTVAADSLIFSQSGADLLITEGMTGGSVRIVGGYANAADAMTQYVAGTSTSQSTGGSTILTIDASGTVTITSYSGPDGTGTALGDTWTNPNDTSGSDTFNADGSRSGDIHNADGSYSTYTASADGLITDRFDASGNGLGSTVQITNAGTVTTTAYSGLDGSGTKLSDTWTASWGAYGSDTFNADGSRSSTTNYDEDNAEIVETDYYSATGLLTSDSWAGSDGSSGADVYNADGSGSSTSNDGQGYVETYIYGATGLLASDTWVHSDGSSGANVYNVDGSSRDTYVEADGIYGSSVTDALGDSTSSSYSASGVLQGVYKADGTSDSYFLAANGASIDTITNADGSFISNSNDGEGDVTTESYAAPNGKLLALAWSSGDAYVTTTTASQTDGSQVSTSRNSSDGSSIVTTTNADGSSGITINDAQGASTETLFDANGSKTSDVWQDWGGHGSDTYNADGTGTGTGVGVDRYGQAFSFDVVTQADGSYVENWTEPDNWAEPGGSYGTNTLNAATGEVTISTATGDGYSESTDITKLANGATELKVSDTNTGSSSYYEDYSKDTVAQADGSYVENWTRSDGSYGTNTLDAATSEVTGSSAMVTDGYTDTWDITTLANGATESNFTETYTDGSTYNTHNLTQSDGSSVDSWSQSDGSFGTNYTSTSASDSDTYTWGPGQGVDHVQAFAGNDTLDISAGVSTDQLWFRQDGINLDITILGTSDQMTIDGWYANCSNGLQGIELSSGQTLAAANVNALVQAMAAFAPPTVGQLSYTAQEQTALAPMLAANWH